MKRNWTDIYAAASWRTCAFVRLCPFALLASACGAIHPQEVTSKVYILGGTPVAEAALDVRRTATVALTTDYSQIFGILPSDIDRGNSFCTATIISKNILLTAAHCVQKWDVKTGKKLPEIRFGKAKKIIGFFGTAVHRDGSWIRAKRVVIHPNWYPQFAREPSPSYAPNDVALIILSEDIPVGYAPANLAPPDLKMGSENISFWGFGKTLDTYINDTGTLREGFAQVITQDNTSKRFTLQSLVHGAGDGDSGGPAFVKVGEKWFVTGVSSTSASSKAGVVESVYTDLRHYFEWITKEIGNYKPR